MNHRFILITLWSVGTIASISVAFAGVAGVRSAIAAPGSFYLPAEATLTPPDDPNLATISSTQATSTPSTVDSTPVAQSTTTSTTEAGPPSSEAQQPASDPDETEVEGATTEPTGPDPESYQVEGGWVSIQLGGNGVYLESASPRPGWTVKVESQGPEEVVVVFKNDEQETHFVAEFEDGRLKVKIED